MGRMSIRLSPSSLLAAIALLVATNARAADQTPPASDAAEKRIADIETRVGGRLGVAALETGSGRRLEHRASERFPMCSTFKLLAAAAVLHRVDQKQEQITRVIPYTKAPVTTEHVKEGGMTLAALCAAALDYSDNTAGNLLLKAIGGPDALTRYARSLGDQETRLDRLEPYLNSAVSGDERDTTTPVAMLGDLRALLLGEALSPRSRDQLEAWLAGNKTGGEMLRAGLPNDCRIADKTGHGGAGATNDIALIRPPGKPPILLAVYSVGSTASPKVRGAAIADVARIVAQTF